MESTRCTARECGQARGLARSGDAWARVAARRGPEQGDAPEAHMASGVEAAGAGRGRERGGYLMGLVALIVERLLMIVVPREFVMCIS